MPIWQSWFECNRTLGRLKFVMRNSLRFTESTFHGNNRQSIQGTLNFINFRNVLCANNSIGCTSFEGFHSTNIIRSPRIISAFRPRAIISLINLSQTEATANLIAAAAVASRRPSRAWRAKTVSNQWVGWRSQTTHFLVLFSSADFFSLSPQSMNYFLSTAGKKNQFSPRVEPPKLINVKYKP